ncbi:hypothetical protein HON22_00290, partial [Candidatus Peregrinibacteria bacterium]|nr:hypothetical protein [Candidatus Peregrinibacteria bacterium]
MSDNHLVEKVDVKFIADLLSSTKSETPFWLDILESFIRNQTSFETQKAYLIDLKQFFSWAFKKGVRSFKDISFKLAIEYRDYLKKFGGRIIDGIPSEASNATVHRKICALS